MLGSLFGAILIGGVIIGCLFLYWIKYVYVEKDDKDIRRGYSPLSQNLGDQNNNNQTLYKVNPNFINKRKAKNK